MSDGIKIFFGENNILVQLDNGGRKLIPKEYLSVYFQIKRYQITNKHVKEFIK